jgi:hypothetical protein
LAQAVKETVQAEDLGTIKEVDLVQAVKEIVQAEDLTVIVHLVQDLVVNQILEETLNQDKCIKQFVQNVVKNVKFHSNQQKVEMFFVVIALDKDKYSSKYYFFIFIYSKSLNILLIFS